MSILRWNDLPEITRNTRNASHFKRIITERFGAAKPPTYYFLGTKLGNIFHSRFRMGLTQLNADIFKYNPLHSPACSCGYPKEDVKHFVLECPNFAQHRIALLDLITTHDILRNLAMKQVINILIFGNITNKSLENSIATSFQNFLVQTKRFSF